MFFDGNQLMLDFGEMSAVGIPSLMPQSSVQGEDSGANKAAKNV